MPGILHIGYFVEEGSITVNGLKMGEIILLDTHRINHD
jgi:hypothetical protein